jgi:hypothetical protein
MKTSKSHGKVVSVAMSVGMFVFDEGLDIVLCSSVKVF